MILTTTVKELVRDLTACGTILVLVGGLLGGIGWVGFNMFLENSWHIYTAEDDNEFFDQDRAYLGAQSII